MLMGKVVGSVVSTRKNENLVGNKFMIVEVADHMRQGAKQIIAIDKIGAGIGGIRSGCTGKCCENRKWYAGSIQSMLPIVGIIDEGLGLE